MLHEWQKEIRNGVRFGRMADGLFAARGDRFFVYSEGYWLRVSESLREDFPLVERLLGARRFEERVRSFLGEERAPELELGEVSPAFGRWLSGGAGLRRAVALDLLAVEARRAGEPAFASGLALHPSVRAFPHKEFVYVFWRGEDGDVLRERIPARMWHVLERLREPAEISEVAARLGALGEDLSFVRETLVDCMEAGILVRR